MTLLEIQAIRALPEEYVIKGMRVVRHGPDMFAHAPGKPSLAYYPETKEWYDLMTGRCPNFEKLCG